MRYVSLFSGIEAASVAWRPLGWEPVAFSEIEPFPCSVLAQRFPHVPNLGDVRGIDWEEFAYERGIPDVLVGGSPCQSFSVAGKREGLAGASGLMWEFVRACSELRPEWVVWENVPGALSSSHGEDFRCLLASLDELGYCVAGRVLDAQFFGVAQRRRRVFLVASLGCVRAVEVLFEPGGLRGDNPSSREKRQELAAGAGRGAASVYGFSAGAGSVGFERENAPTPLAARNDAAAVLPFDTTQITSAQNGSRPMWGDPCHPLSAHAHAPAVACTQYGDVAGTLTARYDSSPCADRGQNIVCITDHTAHAAVDVDLCGTLKCGGAVPSIADGLSVRRLTPLECERLQGFPDGWTAVGHRGKPASDAARYKALGNSMAVPVMRWIGERIDAVEKNASGVRSQA